MIKHKKIFMKKKIIILVKNVSEMKSFLDHSETFLHIDKRNTKDDSIFYDLLNNKDV